LNGKDILDLCVNEAWKYQLLTWPNPAVGAAVVNEFGTIIALCAHQKAGAAHAEVLALQQAYATLSQNEDILALQEASAIHDYLLIHAGNLFASCTIYVTLEPCMHQGKTPSCAHLLEQLQLKQIIVGAKDPHDKAGGACEKLSNTVCIAHKGCEELIYPFRCYVKEKRVEFFKWAQRLDGSLGAGTISGEDSRRHMHTLRAMADILVVGGNTVRTDRPTLDARLANLRPPSLMIYSHTQHFDQSIPCFNVKQREVNITNHLSFNDTQSLIMYEGGLQLLDTLFDRITLFICYISVSVIANSEQHTLNRSFEILHSQKIGEDIVLWMKKKK